MDLLTLEHFAAHVNETYYARIGEDGARSMEVPFVLVEARALSTRLQSQRAPFSLLFRNPSPFLFPQQTYTLRHASLGEAGVFLVPVAREREGFLYQAVFN